MDQGGTHIHTSASALVGCGIPANPATLLEYTYDAADRVTVEKLTIDPQNVIGKRAVKQVVYDYLAHCDCAEAGQLLFVEHPANQFGDAKRFFYQYDEFGRMTQASPSTLISYNRDDTVAGKLSTPQGGVYFGTNYSYDLDRGFLTGIEVNLNPGPTQFTAYKAAYQYDASGNLASSNESAPVQLGPRRGVARSYQYDLLGRLATVLEAPDATYATPGTRYEYGYDLAGNLLSRCDRDLTAQGTPCAIRQEMAYGSYNALVRENSTLAGQPSVISAFEYDVAGRMTKRCEGGVSCQTSTGDFQEYRHNPLGQMTSYLEGIAQGAGTQDSLYRYDGLGRRVKTEHPAQPGGFPEVTTVYSGIAVLQEQTNVSATKVVTQDFCYANGQVNGEVVSVNASHEAERFYVQDYLGTTRLVLDSAGNEEVYLQFDAWGRERVRDVEAGKLGTRVGFAGEERDVFATGAGILGTGMENLYERDYDSATGRFTRTDSLLGKVSRSQSLDRYSYVEGNPTNFVDPLGLQGQAQQAPSCLRPGDLTAAALSGLSSAALAGLFAQLIKQKMGLSLSLRQQLQGLKQQLGTEKTQSYHVIAGMSVVLPNDQSATIFAYRTDRQFSTQLQAVIHGVFSGQIVGTDIGNNNPSYHAERKLIEEALERLPEGTRVEEFVISSKPCPACGRLLAGRHISWQLASWEL